MSWKRPNCHRRFIDLGKSAGLTKVPSLSPEVKIIVFSDVLVLPTTSTLARLIWLTFWAITIWYAVKINNKSFSYINPILKKHTKGKSKNKYKGKHFKKKTVRFKKDLSSTENVGMPTLEPIMSKKKRKNTRKPKKSSTSKNSKKKLIIHE